MSDGPNDKIKLYDDDDTPDPNTLHYPAPALKLTKEMNLTGADLDCAKKAASVLSAAGMRELKAWLELQLLTTSPS